MNRPARIDPNTLARLQEADWYDIGIRLCAYATWKARNYHWRTHGSGMLAAGKTPEDIAREAIARVFDGRRQWNPERGPLLPYLQGVVDSLMSHLATSADNLLLEATQAREGMDTQVDQSAHERIADLKAILTEMDADDLLVVLDAAEVCVPKPAVIALHLNTSVEDIYNRLKRLRRIALRLVPGEKRRARRAVAR